MYWIVTLVQKDQRAIRDWKVRLVVKGQKDAKAPKVHQGHLEKEVIQAESADQVPRGWTE